MEFYQLEYFRKLCEFKRFSKTAEYFHVTQPTISIAIKKLEEEFCGELIDRSNRSFSITPMGYEFLKYANRIHEEIELMHEDLLQYSNRIHKVIRIGMPLSLYGTIVSSIATDFISNHPEIPLHISQTSPEYMEEALCSGNLDMCISFDIFSDSIQKETLGQREFLAYVAPVHPLNGLSEITPDMLNGESFLISKEPIGIGKCMHKYFNEHNIAGNYYGLGNLLPEDAYSRAMNLEGIAFLDSTFSNGTGIPLEPPLFLDTVLAWKKDKTLTKDQKILAKFILSL